MQRKGLMICGMASIAVASGFLVMVGHWKSTSGAQESHLVFESGDSARLRVLGSYGKLPLSFEANQGQTEASVRFLSRGNGYTLFLKSNEAVLTVLNHAAKTGGDRADHINAVLRMRFIGANISPIVTGVDELPRKTSYFIGNNPAKWRTSLPSYAKVRYQNVYPGIDLIYYGNGQQLEYDLIVGPGADPAAIKLDIQGLQQIAMDSGGGLLLESNGEQIRFHKPVLYQNDVGGRREIPGRFTLSQNHQIGFEVGAYDMTKPLVIDPALVYSTYLGGSTLDEASAIAVDSAGNAYITGRTLSPDFPTTSSLPGNSGAQLCQSSIACADAFVAKFNAAGALVYSTFLGGRIATPGGFSSEDFGLGIAVDSAGNAYITGYTYSADFPTKNPFQPKIGGAPDAFVSKLNPTGDALIYSTYLGGRTAEDTFNETAGAIAIDSSGNAYVTGLTNSDDFPATASSFQPKHGGIISTEAFVAKLNAAGSALVYATYLGGAVQDFGTGIAVDSAGSAYVVGFATSANFPTTPGAFRTFTPPSGVFVAKLNASGSALIYSTFLGPAFFFPRLSLHDALPISSQAFPAPRRSRWTVWVMRMWREPPPAIFP